MNKYTFLFLSILWIHLNCASMEYTVVKGDCLWNIAKQYYNNPFLWREIYTANKEKIKNPDLIYPGQVFILPELKYEVQISTSFVEEEVEKTQQLQQEYKQEIEQTEQEMLTLKQTVEQQKVSVSTTSIITEETKEEKFEPELPSNISLENFISCGKIIDAKEKKFIYIDYDIVFCELTTEVMVGDIFAIYHLGPSQYDVNLMNVPNNQLTLVGKLKIIEVKDNKTSVGQIMRIFSPVVIGDMLSKIEHKKK